MFYMLWPDSCCEALLRCWGSWSLDVGRFYCDDLSWSLGMGSRVPRRLVSLILEECVALTASFTLIYSKRSSSAPSASSALWDCEGSGIGWKALIGPFFWSPSYCETLSDPELRLVADCTRELDLAFRVCDLCCSMSGSTFKPASSIIFDALAPGRRWDIVWLW